MKERTANPFFLSPIPNPRFEAEEEEEERVCWLFRKFYERRFVSVSSRLIFITF
jgi:hypothetical protein